MNSTGRTIALISTAAFLFAVAWLDLHIAYRPVQASELVGTYTPDRDRFLPAEDLPGALVLGHPNKLSAHFDGSATRDIGTWKFDAEENVIAVDDPAWDQRIRAIKGWAGTVLAVRISKEQGRAEEIIYHKTGEAKR